MATPGEYEVLLHAHMVCAGDLLHIQAYDELNRKLKRTRMSPKSRAELKKILAIDRRRIAASTLSRKVPAERRRAVYTSLLRYAAIDGYLDPDEQELLARVATAWKMSPDEVTRKRAAVDARLANASWLESLFGDAYHQVLEQCVQQAAEDFPFTCELLDASLRVMETLRQELESVVDALHEEAKPKEATTARAIQKSVDALHASLETKLAAYRRDLEASFTKKRRSRDRVTIAFLGRTRAGKSTIHAVLTRAGRGGIGVGSQRTTRTNRTYEWERLRVIDTPGFGAAVGGEETAKRDAAIARSVLPESDLVCFVVTNDSQQKSDFEVLAAVRALAKPLIVILNFKSSLDDPDLLELALSSPDGLLPAREVAEHEKRIREYARASYGSDDFDVVPVHLFAALLGVEQESEHAAALTAKSGIQTLLDRMRTAIIEEGPIRRTQTLLGMLPGELDPARRWAAGHAEQFAASARTLAAQGNAGVKQLQEAAREIQAELKEEIAAIAVEMMNAVPTFAERNWKQSQPAINTAWETTMNRIAPPRRIEQAARRAEKSYAAKVRAAAESASEELRLIASLQGFSVLLEEQDSSTFGRKLMNVLTIALQIAGAVATFFTGSPVWIWLGSAAENLRTWFMTEEQKRARAVGNIERHLREEIDKYEKTTLKELSAKVRKATADVEKRYAAYFERLSRLAATIHRRLASAERSLVRLADDATHLYAKRIVDLARGKREPLTRKAADGLIAEVERDFGVSLRIVLKKRVMLKVSGEKLSRTLQERISFHFPSRKRR